MDILIKNMEMPSEGRIINLTICSDGSVINNLPDAGGKMSSYRNERVKAVALPEHKKAYWKNAMCSNCGAVRLVSASGNFYYVNYCHNCGAEIVEATE